MDMRQLLWHHTVGPRGPSPLQGHRLSSQRKFMPVYLLLWPPLEVNEVKHPGRHVLPSPVTQI